MWSNYIKYWDGQSLHQAVFITISQLLTAADVQPWEKVGESDLSLAWLHVGSFYNLNDQILSRRLAEGLLKEQ
jgi:hypothetical protein